MTEESKGICGIVRPISELDGCDPEHWQEVHDIISDAIRSAGYEPKLVSEANDGGVIQGRIVKSLYENPIVVCDVSGKNPNVMLELGMRLAFDKPIVVVKDDVTNYSFDTSPIEHVPYRRDLRFASVQLFKENLKNKIIGLLHSASQPGYQSYLQHFGPIKVAELAVENVPAQQFIIDELKELRSSIQYLSRSGRQASTNSAKNGRQSGFAMTIKNVPESSRSMMLADVRDLPEVISVKVIPGDDGDMITVQVHDADASSAGPRVAKVVMPYRELGQPN